MTGRVRKLMDYDEGAGGDEREITPIPYYALRNRRLNPRRGLASHL